MAKNVVEIIEKVEAAAKAHGGFVRRNSSLWGGWLADSEATEIALHFDGDSAQEINARKYAAANALRAQLSGWRITHDKHLGYRVWNLRDDSGVTGTLRAGFVIKVAA